jgi:hypothetical protein
LVPYNFLLGRGHDHDGQFVEVLQSRLQQLLAPFLRQVEMDEEWYLQVNDDVAREVRAGTFASAREHYVLAGYFEDRFPRPIFVDEDWYLRMHPDVSDAIKAGKFQTGQQHFEADGFREGRLPSAGWSLGADRPSATKKLRIAV